METEKGKKCYNEVKTYVMGRYLCSGSSLWKMFEFPIATMFPSVQKLALHLPNEQQVYIRPGEDPNAALDRAEVTTLTAFFQLNREDPSANPHLYPDILKYYVYVKKDRKFKRRVKNTMRTDAKDDDSEAKSDTIGRLAYISLNPTNKELYFLRMLLYNVPGPKSYEDLKTLDDGYVCQSFHESCVKRGLFEDDEEIEKSLDEAANIKFARGFRQCFVTICVYCMPASPLELFEKFKNFLCEDFMKDAKVIEPTDDMVNRALLEMKDMFELAGKNMVTDFGLPEPIYRGRSGEVKEIQEELNHFEFNENLAEEANENVAHMNPEQKNAYDGVFQAVESKTGGLFSIDACAGSGKTFVICTLLSQVRGSGMIALAMATTGIASTLLPGGRTVHSKLKVPINIDEETVISALTRESTAVHKLIKRTDLIIIDEVTIGNKLMYEAIDRTLRKVLDPNKPFGGIPVLVTGDWMQVRY